MRPKAPMTKPKKIIQSLKSEEQKLHIKELMDGVLDDYLLYKKTKIKEVREALEVKCYGYSFLYEDVKLFKYIKNKLKRRNKDEKFNYVSDCNDDV